MDKTAKQRLYCLVYKISGAYNASMLANRYRALPRFHFVGDKIVRLYKLIGTQVIGCAISVIVA